MPIGVTLKGQNVYPFKQWQLRKKHKLGWLLLPLLWGCGAQTYDPPIQSPPSAAPVPVPTLAPPLTFERGVEATVRFLFTQADADRNQQLSLAEVLKHKTLDNNQFVSSDRNRDNMLSWNEFYQTYFALIERPILEQRINDINKVILHIQATNRALSFEQFKQFMPGTLTENQWRERFQRCDTNQNNMVDKQEYDVCYFLDVIKRFVDQKTQQDAVANTPCKNAPASDRCRETAL